MRSHRIHTPVKLFRVVFDVQVIGNKLHNEIISNRLLTEILKLGPIAKKKKTKTICPSMVFSAYCSINIAHV